MHVKSFTFGLGVGILCTAAIFYILINWFGLGTIVNLPYDTALSPYIESEIYNTYNSH